MTDTLIYVHDPLCGFCWGFREAIEQVGQDRPDLNIHVALGGLSIGDRIGPYSNMADYIRQATPRVTEVSGAKFGAAFLDERIKSDALSSSNPPAAGILQVRAEYPHRACAFAHAIQEAHFLNGADLNDASLYPEIAQQLGIGDLAFDIPAPRDLPDALQQEYTRTRRLNFSGFPSLFLAKRSEADFSDLRPVELTYQGDALLSKLEAMAPAKATA